MKATNAGGQAHVSEDQEVTTDDNAVERIVAKLERCEKKRPFCPERTHPESNSPTMSFQRC